MLQPLASKILSLLAEPVPLVEGQWLNISFDVPILVDITAPVTMTLKLIYVTECILTVFGMFLMPYFTHFVNSSGVIHRNLQSMLSVSVAVYIWSAFARFYLILVQFKIVTDLDTPYFLIAGLIRMQHYGLSLSAILVVTVERSFATYYVVDYESKPRNWVAVFSFTVGLVYTELFMIPICFFQAPLYYLVLFAVLWGIFAKIVLHCLHKYNARELKRLSWKASNLKKMENVNYTLGKKFQVEENVKVIRLLISLSFMLVVLVSFVIMLIVVPTVYLGRRTNAGQVMISLFDLNLALAAIFIPVICIYQLRKKFDLPFTRKIHCLNKKRADRNGQVNPITVFHDVTNTYFEQFHTDWK